MRTVVLALGRADPPTSIDALERGWVKPADLVRTFGPSGILARSEHALSSQARRSLAERVLMGQIPNDDAAGLLDALLSAPRPWLDTAIPDEVIADVIPSQLFTSAVGGERGALVALLVSIIAEPAIDSSRYDGLGARTMNLLSDEFPIDEDDGELEDDDEAPAQTEEERKAASFWLSMSRAVEARLGYEEPEAMDFAFEDEQFPPRARELLRAWGRGETRFVAARTRTKR